VIRDKLLTIGNDPARQTQVSAILSTPPGGALPLPALSLPEQLMMLRRRWRVIFLTALLLPAAAAIAISFTKPSYTATGILLYDPGNIVTTAGPLQPAQDQQNEDAAIASQTAVITSLPAARDIAQTLNLAADPAFNPSLRHRPWPLSLLKPAPPEGPDQIAQTVQAALQVDVPPNSRILAVSFTAANPALAASAANLAMQIYLDHQRDDSFAELSDAQDWLEKNAASIQAGLDVTEAQLAKARAAAGVVPGAQASLTTETASRIAASLVQAQADLAMNQARLSSAAQGDAAAANAAIAPNLLPLRKEQADLTAQVQSLQGQYGADYPDLVAARRSLAAITDEINAETSRELDAAHADVAADQAEIATLQGALNQARDESQAEDTDSAPVRALEQRAEAGRAMLRSMTEQADQLAQEASMTKPEAHIISDAAPPSSPCTPHRLPILAGAGILGLCLGLLLAGLQEALDTSLRSGEALRTITGLACLALLPEIRAPQTAPLESPYSVFSEQLRSLRTALALGEAGGGNQVLAITAARPGEGKTTLTVALARALASSGLKVVAVDGDIRQPSFDPVFDLAGCAGLTDHLSGAAALEAVIKPDPLTSLAVIPAGNHARNALALFLSPALPAFLASLRARYDVVLLDVPPAFALAEGRVLTRAADGALLCVRWGHTPQKTVTAAITLLREAGILIRGTALTRVDAAAHGRSGFPDAEMYQPRYGGYFRETA
jgi:succinoglycan biosynthesis transport protein ExoP